VNESHTRQTETEPPQEGSVPEAAHGGSHSGSHHAPAAEKPAISFFAHPNRTGLDVYLMRHASAGTRRVNPKLDVKRPLDKDGKRHCLQLAQVLNGLNISFDLIVSSPLKRCLQTAQLVGTEMGYESKILHAQALEPGADYAQFQRLLHECRNYENVLMVGHNPNMTAFLGKWIAGHSAGENGNAPSASVRLRKGSIARVTVERGPGMLKWLLDPRIVRALYATSTKSSRRKTSRK
jgi:phosphohistidine phosphatase